MQVAGSMRGKSPVFYVRPQMIKRHISASLLTTPLPICHWRVVSFNAAAAAAASSEGALSPAQRSSAQSYSLPVQRKTRNICSGRRSPGKPGVDLATLNILMSSCQHSTEWLDFEKKTRLLDTELLTHTHTNTHAITMSSLFCDITALLGDLIKHRQ